MSPDDVVVFVMIMLVFAGAIVAAAIVMAETIEPRPPRRTTNRPDGPRPLTYLAIAAFVAWGAYQADVEPVTYLVDEIFTTPTPQPESQANEHRHP